MTDAQLKGLKPLLAFSRAKKTDGSYVAVRLCGELVQGKYTILLEAMDLADGAACFFARFDLADLREDTWKRQKGLKVKSKDLAEMLQWVREVFDNKVVRWMPEGVLGTYEADPLVGSIEICMPPAGVALLPASSDAAASQVRHDIVISVIQCRATLYDQLQECERIKRALTKTAYDLACHKAEPNGMAAAMRILGEHGPKNGGPSQATGEGGGIKRPRAAPQDGGSGDDAGEDSAVQQSPLPAAAVAEDPAKPIIVRSKGRGRGRARGSAMRIVPKTG